MSHGLDTILLHHGKSIPDEQVWYWVYSCHCGRKYSIQSGGNDSWFGERVYPGHPIGWYLPINNPEIGFYNPRNRCWESFGGYLYDMHTETMSEADLITNRNMNHSRLI